MSAGDRTLEFSLEPATLDAGSAEERAAFGKLTVVANGRVMTEGVALGSNELQTGPHVSGYHLSEWLVRNWWRLAYEPTVTGDPEQTAMDWDLAHWISTIGEGYVWPNIRIDSDGLRVTITSYASIDPYTTAFRYMGAARSETVGVAGLREAVRNLAKQVLDMLGHSAAGQTELHDLWSRLQGELDDPYAVAKRRVEALLGLDTDEASPAELQTRLADAEVLGSDAVAELAADATARGGRTMNADEIARVADAVGFAGSVADMVELPVDAAIPAWGSCEAWRIGVATARAVRRRAGINDRPMGNATLASLAGTSANAITSRSRNADCISFAIDADGNGTRIAMRSKWETGRRFDLARLTAERLFVNGISEPLRPATQSYTYRQKGQRAFAAELLAPIGAIEDFLGRDRSDERCNEAAQHFMVSPVVIHSLLGSPSRDGR